MKTRPHIVTQSRLYPVETLRRSAAAIARRMSDVAVGKDLRELIGYSRVLIRVMKIILDLTRCNDCFIARREALASPDSRREVTDTIGGAPALLKWRRKNTWNKARLAAIASGEYRPPQGYDASVIRPAVSRGAKPQPPARAPGKPYPAFFRLPVLQNLAAQSRPAVCAGVRAAPQARFPSIVLWPHELDGQYVPNFKSRARHPEAPEFETASADNGPSDRPPPSHTGAARAPP